MNNLLKTYNFSNFEIVKGNGCYLYTSDNKKLLDFSAGVAVNSLGYNHSVIKKTLQEQLKTGITHLSGLKYIYIKLNYLNCFQKKATKEMFSFLILGQKALKRHLKLLVILEVIK
jgi:acetylornithine/succinyldiaminopimelate/putrescine aminotransferase